MQQDGERLGKQEKWMTGMIRSRVAYLSAFLDNSSFLAKEEDGSERLLSGGYCLTYYLTLMHRTRLLGQDREEDTFNTGTFGPWAP